ncbi:hypothetical protein [Caulobacter sp. LARHSG274]
MMTFWGRLVELFTLSGRYGEYSPVVYMIGYDFWWTASSPPGLSQAAIE